MKCQIKWIDANGNDTPDENDAIGLAYMRDNRGEWSEGHPICKAHAAQLVAYHISWPGTDHEIVTEWKLERFAKRQGELRSTCKAKWEGQRCGETLTASDLLDNVDGYCARCAGILSDNGEW